MGAHGREFFFFLSLFLGLFPIRRRQALSEVGIADDNGRKSGQVVSLSIADRQLSTMVMVAGSQAVEDRRREGEHGRKKA